MSISWGAIFAGVVASLGLWSLLYALGLALGFSAVNPDAPASMRGSGMFTGVWGMIAPLVALFVGAMVAARASGSTRTHLEGALHGLVVWGTTALVGMWLVANLLGALLTGAGAIGKTAVEATGAALGGVAAGAPDWGQALGMNGEQMLAPVNQRLQAEGKAPISADQLRSAMGDVAKNAVATGRFDREAMVSALSANTSLSTADVDELAGRIEQQVNEVKARAEQAKQKVEHGALEAVDRTGKVFWGVFGALFLGLAAAVAGGALGVGKREQRGIRAARRPAIDAE